MRRPKAAESIRWMVTTDTARSGSRAAEKRELTFGPFEKLRFDWESFGTDGRRGTKEYHAGEVKILTGP